MALISNSLPNLINGVSQQPFTLRLASQSEEQINGLSSVSEGLKKRPPTRYVAKIQDTPVTNAFSHVINRDAAEQYVVTIAGQQVQVHDLVGNPRVVHVPQGTGYLSTPTPETDLQAVTVADYTFIVNKTVKVLEDTGRRESRPYQCLIWIKQGAYSTSYKFTVNDKEALYTTPYSGSTAGEQANAQLQVQPQNIAQQLINSISSGLAEHNIRWSIVGATIFLESDADFSVAIYDALGDNSMGLVKGKVQRFSDLPAKAWPDMKVEIVGTDDNNFDDYWVQYKSEATNPHGGVWQECPADNEPLYFLNYTMPHLLVRQEDGSFSFEEAVFDGRSAGDSESAPMPSFVGSQINGIVFHRNRLGLMADENIVFSRAGEFFNFWRHSAIQTLDTDPIDVAITTTSVNVLKQAVPFNDTLMLLSDQSQFQLAKADLLTPKTIGINLTTSFSCNTLAKPVNAGNNVYFAQTRGGYSGLREYYVDPVTSVNDATDVTAHCPTYVAGQIRKMTGSTNENTIVCLSDTVRDTIYIYRYYWAQQTKLQSSWSKWVLPAGSTILDCEFINSTLILIVSRSDGVFIESLYMASGAVDTNANYQIYLDRRFDNSKVLGQSYFPTTDGTQGVTHVIIPWVPQVGEDYTFLAWSNDTGDYKQGQVIPYTLFFNELNGFWTFILQGRVGTFIAGVKYPFSYTFSPFIMREQAPGGSGSQAVTEGRLQIRHLRVAYSQTGYFEAHVTPASGDTYTYPFTGRILGGKANVVGQIALDTSQFVFPVASKNDQVTIELFNDTHLPCAFLSAEWEGFYTIRSRRM